MLLVLIIIIMLHKLVRTSVADELLIICLLHKRVRTSVSDEIMFVSLLHKRVRTSIADDMFFRSVCRRVHDVNYRMYIFNASTLLINIYLLYFTEINTTFLIWIKCQRILAIENRELGHGCCPNTRTGKQQEYIRHRKNA